MDINKFFDDLMLFVENVEKVVDAIFALVEKIMSKVDEFGAEEA